MSKVHRGDAGYRPMTDREKSEFYRKLARLRKTLREAMKPIYVAVGGRIGGSNALATVQAITTVMKVLEAMRTEAVYEAGEAGAGYPDIGAAAGISRQAAREQWPGAVRSPKPAASRCPLSAYLRKVASLPDIECDAFTPRAFYWLEYKVVPAGVQVSGCLTHVAMYGKLMGQSALHLSGDEARRARGLMASRELIDPIRDLLQAQAHHGNVVAMRELAWRMETAADADADEAATGWLQAAAERGDRFAARAWTRHLEQQGRMNDVIEVWRRLAAVGDRFACIELASIYARYKRRDLAAEVWRPLAAKGDGFALRAIAEALHAAHRIDEAIPVFQRAYEHHRQKWGKAGAFSDRESRAACHALIDLLIEDGQDHQALAWLRRVVKADPAPTYAMEEKGDPAPEWALEELTWRLERAGQLDEAEGWLRYAVDREAEGWYRHAKPSKKLYQFLLRTGRTSQAEALLRDPTARGLAKARGEVFRRLKTAGREADLSAFASALIAEGQQEEFSDHATQLERTGSTDEAITMWRTAAEQGDFHARWEAVRLMDHHGHTAEAEAWLRDLIRAGQTSPMEEATFDEDRDRWHAQRRARDREELSARQATRVLAALLERHGRTEEALTLLRRTADQGDRYARRDLQRMIARSRHGTQSKPT